MLIAQLSVASEDVDRPRPPKTPTAETDQEALEEFACDRSNLPWVIFRAAHRASHATTLPARARALLAALARTVDANRPYAAIFARRELLTGRAMQSMRTFYRSLDDLESAGLIVRPPQKRHGEAGLFGRAYLHLTDKATFVLGLVERQLTEDKTGATSFDGANTPAALSLASPSATVADGAIYKDLDPKIQKRQSGTVPGDLKRLLNLGFHEFLIFKLMREAKAQAKLLSDVVEATWEHLRNAKRPISYLRALLRSPVDFGHQIRAKRLVAERLTEENARAANIDATVLQCAGHEFIDTANTRLITVSSTADSITVHDYRETRPRVSTGQWTAAFVAALNAREVVRATSDQITAFRLKCDNNHAVQQKAIEPPGHAIPRTRTSTINDRLSEMKQMLRATCAGVSSDIRDARLAARSGQSLKGNS